MAIDAGDGAVAWTFRDPSVIDAVPEFQGFRILHLSVSLDGKLVAISIPNFSTVVGAEDAAAGPGRVLVLDAETGDVVKTLESACALTTAQWSGFTADGKWLAVSTGSEACVDFQDPDASWVSLFDTATWQEGPRLTLEGGLFEVANFTADGSRVLLADLPTEARELRSFPELELVNEITTGKTHSSLGPTGQQVVGDPPGPSQRKLLFRADTGERISYLEIDDFVTGDSFQFSPDGSLVGVPTRTHDYVFDAENGELLVDLGNTGTTNALDFTADGSRLLTTNSTGAQIWDLTGTVTSLTVPDAQPIWINSNAVVDGPDLAIRVVVFEGPGPDEEREAWVTLLVEPDTGATIDHIAGDSLQLPDGRFVVAQRSLGVEEQQLGPLVVLDRASGSTTELDGCVALLEDLVAGAEIDCPGPFFSWYAFDHGHLVSSADGSFFVATSYAASDSDRAVRVWNSDDLAVRSEFSIPYVQEAFAAGPTWIAAISNPDVVAADTTRSTITVYDVDTGTVIAVLEGPAPKAAADTVNAVTSDGSLLFVGDRDGLALAFDTSSWGQAAKWQAHDARLRGFAISPDGARLVTTGQDNLVKVWDISGLVADGSLAGPPPLLDRIPAEFPTDAAWLSSDRLAVFLSQNVQYLNVSLSTRDLVNDAAKRLTRSFSVEECAVYQIDPCPPLEQVRTR